MAFPFNTASRIPCEVQGCNTDFARQADMHRHVKEHHGIAYRCPEPNCSWPGAKRKSRLDLHLQKEHGDIHKKVDLVVPEYFGSASPSRSPYLPAQGMQPGTPGAGATATPYGGYGDAANYPRNMSVQSDSGFLMTQDNSMMLPASQNQGTQQYANMPPSNAGAYNTGYYSYTPQQAAPVDGYAASPSHPNAEDQYQEATGERAASGSGQQGRDAGRRKKKRSHHHRS